MTMSALLRLATGVALTTIALGVANPAHARTDWGINPNAPRWLDETIYRPTCLPSDCICDCRPNRVCLPVCLPW
jgi:hypothetical protein